MIWLGSSRGAGRGIGTGMSESGTRPSEGSGVLSGCACADVGDGVAWGPAGVTPAPVCGIAAPCCGYGLVASIGADTLEGSAAGAGKTGWAWCVGYGPELAIGET